MKEVVKLIEKVVSEKQIDRHQGLNAVLDFLIGMFDVNHYLKPEGWLGAVAKAEKEEPHLFKIMLIWMDTDAVAEWCSMIRYRIRYCMITDSGSMIYGFRYHRLIIR